VARPSSSTASVTPRDDSAKRSAKDAERCSRSRANFPTPLSRARYGRSIQGLCPKCSGAGPVDVHVSRTVWSALFLTSWSSAPQLSCRSCGIKSQSLGAAFNVVLGWWGFPWGLVVTPIQIGRNLFGMSRPPEPSKPSLQLEKVVRMTSPRKPFSNNPQKRPPQYLSDRPSLGRPAPPREIVERSPSFPRS